VPHLTRSLSNREAIVQLVVGVSTTRAATLRAGGQPLPPPVVVRALIDTGASGTVVHEPSIAPLGLQPAGIANVHTPSTAGVSVPRFKYDVGLAVLDQRANFIIGNRPVVATGLSGTGIEALIGCVVLANCLFLYDGAAQTFTLAF
jgi:hypothetical protein